MWSLLKRQSLRLITLGIDFALLQLAQLREKRQAGERGRPKRGKVIVHHLRVNQFSVVRVKMPTEKPKRQF